ncbi:MAG: DinB family protein [Burkholderiales bacterium]
MSPASHVRLMASYNEWMNAKLFDAATKLSDEALAEDRKAFFGSILGTLNHIVVGDTIWLKRFATHPVGCPALDPVRALPAPVALNQILFTDIRSLAAQRRMLDEVITNWAASVTDADLDHVLRYANTKGVVSEKSFFSLVMHFFNHQTHHRGQATTLLHQAGIDVGVTDLLVLIPNEASA